MLLVDSFMPLVSLFRVSQVAEQGKVTVVEAVSALVSHQAT